MAQDANGAGDEARRTLSRLAQDGLVQAIADFAVEGGGEIVRIMAKGFETRTKSDASPVTVCDEAAERIILDRLAARFPGIPIVAEEAVSKGFSPACGDLFFLVDPLDGTREFVSGKNEFTVNIALVCKGDPVAGAVYAPVAGALWVGERMGARARAAKAQAEPGGAAPAFADMSPIHARPAPARGLVALVSRSHSSPQVEDYLARLPVAERRAMGSSLKFCLIAEGEGDVYPRMSPTMEWDTAAGDAVLRAAGGATRDEAGALLRYGKSTEGFRNPSFIARGAP